MSSEQAIILVQRITTVWTKQSRGAPGSIRRNTVPEALELPLAQYYSISWAVFEHNVTFYEHSGFQEPSATVKLTEDFDSRKPIVYGCVSIEKRAETLVVKWKYDSRDAGIPPRHAKAKDTFELGLNQWARIVYNGRFSRDWEGGWWYEKKVVNVGPFSGAMTSAFTGNDPEIVLDKTERLY